MAESLVFVANLDAELELLDSGYERSSHMRASIRGRLEILRSALGVGANLVLDADDAQSKDLRGGRGECWSPTPGALAVLDACGVPRPAAPGIEVLRAVNHRGFAFEIGPPLPGSAFVRGLPACANVFALAGEGPLLLKRALGFAGRMRKVVVPSRIDRSERTWIEASLTGPGGGLLIEPLVAVEMDVSLHGRVDPDGSLVRGRPIAFTNDPGGGFVAARHAGAGDLTSAEGDALRHSFDRCATALRAAGYFGPFGIDAFRWCDRAGAQHFHPLGEINARYTMAWWRGMAGD